MHIEINSRTLASAAAAAARVAGRKTAVAPIYHHVLLEADAAGLTLTAVDDRVSLRRRVGVEHVHRAGKVCLPAETLSALASKIPPAATVSLEYDTAGASVMLSFGRARHAIPCLPADDFPPLASDTYESSVQVDAASLNYGLTGCAPFAERDIEHVTHSLAGVHIRKTGDTVEMVAATQRHAAREFLGADGDVTPVIIPHSSVQIISSLLSGVEGPAILKTSATKVRIEIDGIEMVSRVIDAIFPNIDGAEEALSFNQSFVADPVEIKSAVERLKVLAEQDTKLKTTRYIHMTAHRDTLYIYASPTCVEEMTITPVEKQVSISLGSGNLALLLSSVQGETEVKVSIDGEASGGAMKVEPIGRPARAFCMGMRMKQPALPELA
ncbi:hypothetical protein [Paracoccus sp. SSK6]|uniref:DNA polymerase III subunit beta family protein n=1 Tax=Paracoccus sp. SSK6 TaxID=3143131 RepID=UPI003219DA06